MRKLSLEECKKISFDILCDIADYCEKHDLRYFLSVGITNKSFHANAVHPSNFLDPPGLDPGRH